MFIQCLFIRCLTFSKLHYCGRQNTDTCDGHVYCHIIFSLLSPLSFSLSHPTLVQNHIQGPHHTNICLWYWYFAREKLLRLVFYIVILKFATSVKMNHYQLCITHNLMRPENLICSYIEINWALALVQQSFPSTIC